MDKTRIQIKWLKLIAFWVRDRLKMCSSIPTQDTSGMPSPPASRTSTLLIQLSLTKLLLRSTTWRATRDLLYSKTFSISNLLHLITLLKALSPGSGFKPTRNPKSCKTLKSRGLKLRTMMKVTSRPLRVTDRFLEHPLTCRTRPRLRKFSTSSCLIRLINLITFNRLKIILRRWRTQSKTRRSFKRRGTWGLPNSVEIGRSWSLKCLGKASMILYSTWIRPETP